MGTGLLSSRNSTHGLVDCTTNSVLRQIGQAKWNSPAAGGAGHVLLAAGASGLATRVTWLQRLQQT